MSCLLSLAFERTWNISHDVHCALFIVSGPYETVFRHRGEAQLPAADQAEVWTAPCLKWIIGFVASTGALQAEVWTAPSMKWITGFVASTGALQAEVLVLQMQLMLKWMPSRNLLIWTSKS
jgi:hypothetical protein